MKDMYENIRKSAGKRPRLTSEARTLKTQIESDSELDSGGQVVLRMALESLMRLREAQTILASEGAVVRDRFGQPRVHPAVDVEHKARMQFITCIKQLGLDLEPLNSGPGRPPGR
jgi:phage terminase small subunit